MTEITRVPLQPIAKGSVLKLWVGVAAALLVAGGIAVGARPPLVSVKAVTAGTGASPTMSDVAIVKMKGTLKDGTVFQPEGQGPLPLAESIPGFAKALMQMQKGGSYKVVIPWSQAYGDKAVGPIPAKSDLYFDITLLEFMNAREFQQQMALMQQMRALQGRGGEHGAPVPEAPAQ